MLKCSKMAVTLHKTSLNIRFQDTRLPNFAVLFAKSNYEIHAVTLAELNLQDWDQIGWSRS